MEVYPAKILTLIKLKPMMLCVGTALLFFKNRKDIQSDYPYFYTLLILESMAITYNTDHVGDDIATR